MKLPPTTPAKTRATHRRVSVLASLTLTASAAVIAFGAAPPVPKPAPVTATVPLVADADWKQFQANVQPFLAKNCYECHGEKDPENNFRLDQFTDAAALAKGRKALADIYDKLLHQEMPPKEKARPAPAQLAAAFGWLEQHLDVDCTGPRDPGRVTLRRLNRTEYNNTIRDLLSIDVRPADSFPTDMSGYGFDNNGDVLSIAPVLMEKYLTAANFVLDKVINAEPVIPPPLHRVEGPAAEGTIAKGDATATLTAPGPNFGVNARRGNPVGRIFEQAGELYDDYVFPTDGEYILRARLYGIPGTPAPGAGAPVAAAGAARGAAGAAARGAGGGRANGPNVTFLLDGKPVGQLNPVPADFRAVAVVSLKPLHVTAGKHRITLAFLNGPTADEVAAAKAAAAAAPAAPETPPPAPAPVVAAAGARRGAAAAAAGARRGAAGPPASPTGKTTLAVIYFEAEGPMAVTPERMPESYRRLMVAMPSATVSKAQAAEQIIRPFTSRAFRRPVRADEVQHLMEFWTKADAAGHTFNESLQLTLQTVLASPQFLFRVEADPSPGEGKIHTLTEYELATRLSYFLWSSMPDNELFQLASAGKLRASLPAQIQRMLKDPRASALVENFAGQWLQLRQMQNVAPDTDLFPFDDELRSAMIQETQLFFNAIIQEDRSVLDFLDANFSYVNERLAKHYGLAGVKGEAFQRVTFAPGDHRGGLLTQASILTVTSYPGRTSPVQRGKWILENLLDDAPPPPPPNVPPLAEKEITGTLRQRMEQHRANPQCASCHARMDPIGFSLENFDAVGAWRTKDANNDTIDASGKLPSGKTFTGPEELKQIVKLQQDKFAHTMAAKLLTFALGRGLEDDDSCVVDSIGRALKANGYKFSVLVNEIVTSDPFQKRAGKPEIQTTMIP